DEQRRRAERRGRRRERNADQTDTAARTERTSPDGGGSQGAPTRNEPQRTIKHAAMTAVAGAIAAGLARAGPAWLTRRRNVAPRERDAEPEAVTHDEADIGADATQAPESHAEQAQAEEPSEAGEPDVETEPQFEGDLEEPTAEEDDEGPQAVQEEAVGETEDEHEPEPEARHEPEAEEQDEGEERTDEPQHDAEPTAQAEPEDQGKPEPQPTSAGEARSMADEARQQVEQLLGSEVEGVTGFERSDGHWSVNVEVVELHRVPDSMDVLASYEVVLDDDRNLVRLERTRRYHRAHVEDDG